MRELEGFDCQPPGVISGFKCTFSLAKAIPTVCLSQQLVYICLPLLVKSYDLPFETVGPTSRGGAVGSSSGS